MSAEIEAVPETQHNELLEEAVDEQNKVEKTTTEEETTQEESQVSHMSWYCNPIHHTQTQPILFLSQ